MKPNFGGLPKGAFPGGLALGLFIAFTPSLGVQMILAGLGAFLLRVNIPIALAACWVTNPLTAPGIYLLQYELGRWLNWMPPSEEVFGQTGALKNFLRVAKPLWIGSLISSATLSFISYLLVNWSWGFFSTLRRPATPPLPRKKIRP